MESIQQPKQCRTCSKMLSSKSPYVRCSSCRSQAREETVVQNISQPIRPPVSASASGTTHMPPNTKYFKSNNGAAIHPPSQATPRGNATQSSARPPAPVPSSKPGPFLPISFTSLPLTSANSKKTASTSVSGISGLSWQPISSSGSMKRTYQEMSGPANGAPDAASLKSIMQQHAKQVATKLGAQISASAGLGRVPNVSKVGTKSATGPSLSSTGKLIPYNSIQAPSHVATKATAAKKFPKLTPVEFQTEDEIYQILSKLQKRVKQDQIRYERNKTVTERHVLQFHGFISLVAKDHMKEKQKARLVATALRKRSKVPFFVKDLHLQENSGHRATIDAPCRCMHHQVSSLQAKGKAPAGHAELPGLDVDDGTSSEANSSVHMNLDMDTPDNPIHANGHNAANDVMVEETCGGIIKITVEEDRSHPFVRGQKLTVEILHQVISTSDTKREWEKAMGLRSTDGVMVRTVTS